MPEENKKDICKKETLICSSPSFLLFLSRPTRLALWVFFVAVCSIFTRKHWFTVKRIHRFSGSGPNVPPLLHQCHSFLAPLPGDANWTPSTLSGERHLARGWRLFYPRGPPAVPMPPRNTSPPCIAPLAPSCRPGHCQGQLCNGMVFSMYAGEEHVHYCRWSQARVLAHPAGPSGCAPCATSPKEQRKSVVTTAWEPGIKVRPRRRWKREETRGRPTESSRKRTGTSVCTYTSTGFNLLHCNTQVFSPLFNTTYILVY